MALSTIQNNSFADTAVHGQRNMLYNGAHTVAQRATQVTGVTSTGFYTTDRWEWSSAGEETVTLDQSTDAPEGFSNSYKVTVTTADSTVANNDYGRILQELEGQDCQRLAFGTSSAKSSTLSFWVKSSVTGTYAVLFQNTDASRYLSKTYTINSANTWEYKTITFVGDTTGAVTSDNTVGLRFFFWLTAGGDYTSTDGGDVWNANDGTGYAYGHTADIIGTLNATWQFTGVQWEVGSEPTPFEHRPFGDELRRCQRYYFKHKADGANDPILGTASNWSTTGVYSYFQFPVQMRTAPSGSYSALTDFRYYIAGATKTPAAIGLSARVTNYAAEWDVSSSGLTAGQAGWLRAANGNAYIEYDAEL
jgi:hypothetical protein